VRSPGPTLDVRAALTAEVCAAQDELSGALNAKALHAGRVRLKRARALARIGRAGAPGLAKVFDDAARALMHVLAPHRDLRALAAIADTAAKAAGKKAAAALRDAAARLEDARAALAPLDRAALDGALKDLHALAQVWPEASARQVARGAAAIARRARSARRRGLRADDLATRHLWRRREKQRLYALEALGAAWPRVRKRNLTTRLCNALGQERDARILLTRLTTHPVLANDDPAPKGALRALRKKAKKWRKRANKLGERLRSARA
jgi:hypothetical protein